MRILYHHRTQSEDAQGVHIYEMVKAFRDLGHDVDVVALVTSDQENKKQGPEQSVWGWLRRCMPNWTYELMGLAYNAYGYWNLCKKIKSDPPAFIYERYALNTFCGIWASWRFGVPLVLEVNAPLFYEQNKLGQLTFKRLARFSERWICSHSTRTVVVSKVMKEILAQEGIPEEHMTVMPNGINPDQFHPSVSGETVRQRYGLEGKLIVGFVGWFRKWHGLEMLLEIMHEAQMGQRAVRLLLVGDGPAYPDLVRYVEQYNLGSAVIFTGAIQRSEIPAYIAAMDITVQPSAPEYACPMKIIEYMGMGKCIVAPDQPNIREVLENEVTGLLFQKEDRMNLLSALIELVNDSIKREDIGRKAYQRIVEQELFWETNARRVLSLVFG